MNISRITYITRKKRGRETAREGGGAVRKRNKTLVFHHGEEGLAVGNFVELRSETRPEPITES